jgi:uncharacterized protein YggE
VTRPLSSSPFIWTPAFPASSQPGLYQSAPKTSPPRTWPTPRSPASTQLSINQETDNASPPKIVGFRVRNGLSATLRDLQGAGAVIDAAVQAGGDAARIDSISFSCAHPSSLLVEARNRAIGDSKDRAQQLADGLGVGLGKVISISESGSNGRPIREFAELTVSTPILPGESEVTLQITVIFEISTK